MVEDLVDEMKVLSWHWILARVKVPTCLYYKWCWYQRLLSGVGISNTAIQISR